jgi:hypothetical protein
MIREDLIAECVAIDSYREIVQYLADKDPTSRRVVESILPSKKKRTRGRDGGFARRLAGKMRKQAWRGHPACASQWKAARQASGCPTRYQAVAECPYVFPWSTTDD